MILRLLWLGRLPHTNQPFLFAKLNIQPGTAAVRPPSGPISRILHYGESKWQELGRHPSHSLRGRIYQAGSTLIDRIPMQERMLWRLHAYTVAQQTKFALPPAVEHAPELDASTVKKELGVALDGWIAVHRRWRVIHGMAIVPAVLLSVLPFVKLWLAWEIFRTVTHHRALMAATWLKRSMAIRAGGAQSAFLANPELSSVWKEPRAVDGELPSVLRRLL